MSLPSVKDLKQLAKACRKAGIKHFKSGEFEFTLTDDLPAPIYKSKKIVPDDHASLITDSPSEDDLLFWSVGNPNSAEGVQS